MTYFRQAGAQAVARSAHREAVAAFEQALRTLQHLLDSRDTHEQAIDLRLALRHALYPLGERGRIFVYLQDAQALAEDLGDHRLGWVAAYLLAHFLLACELDHALAAGQCALTSAATLGEVGLTVTAHYYLGVVYHCLGDYGRAVECFQKNVACLHGDILHKRFGLPGAASVFSRSLVVVSLAECGAFAEGRAPAEEGVRIAEAADHPYSRGIAYWAVGFRALRQGNMLQAVPILEQALDLAQEMHLRVIVPSAASSLGAAYVLAGRTAEALLLEQAVEQASAMRYMILYALRAVWLGEAYMHAGRMEEAYTQAQRALEFARAHQERGHEAYALRLFGEIAARREPPEATQAEAHYQHALTLAEELGMRPLTAHCYRGLGTLYSQMGRLEEARAALSTAVDMYRAMEMTLWLPQVEAALKQRKGRP